MPKKTAIENLRSKPGMPKIKPIALTNHHLMVRNVASPVYDTFHSLPHGARQAVMHALFEAAVILSKGDPLWFEKLLKGELKLVAMPKVAMRKKEPRVAPD